MQARQRLHFCLLNDKGEKVSMYYDLNRKQFVMDRSESGTVDFSKDFPAVTVAPANVDKELTLRLFVDRSSIEAFGEDGKICDDKFGVPFTALCENVL